MLNLPLPFFGLGQAAMSPIPTELMWFDNPKSLGEKFQIGKDLGVRGVGPFTFFQSTLSLCSHVDGTYVHISVSWRRILR